MELGFGVVIHTLFTGVDWQRVWSLKKRWRKSRSNKLLQSKVEKYHSREVSWRIFMVDRCPSNAPARCGLENMPLTTIKHPSDDSAPKTKNRPALCMPLIPQFQNDLKVKHILYISRPMPAKLLQSLLQPRSFSGSWSGRGCGSKRQKITTNVKKDHGRIWLAKLKARERKGRIQSPETGIGGEWWWMIMTMIGQFYPPKLSGPGTKKYVPITWRGQGKSLQRAPEVEASDVYVATRQHSKKGILKIIIISSSISKKMQKESKKNKKITNPPTRTRTRGDILTAPTLPPQFVGCWYHAKKYNNPILILYLYCKLIYLLFIYVMLKQGKL